MRCLRSDLTCPNTADPLCSRCDKGLTCKVRVATDTIGACVVASTTTTTALPDTCAKDQTCFDSVFTCASCCASDVGLNAQPCWAGAWTKDHCCQPPPTSAPTRAPTTRPSEKPTTSPTSSPTLAPTATKAPVAPAADTRTPTRAPTKQPTDAPTKTPTEKPTGSPTTAKPTLAPTTGPSAAPSRSPTSSYCANQCSAVRTRKNWNKINATERALYIEAVQTLYKSGAYEKFVLIHQNGVNDPFAHGTSGFLPWHRKFLLEFENALRCLDVKFACVTVPYWDWGEWQFYCNSDPAGCKTYDSVPAKLLAENKNAQSLIKAFGGPGIFNVSMAKKMYGDTDHPKGVGCVQTGPFAYWTDFDGNCLTRSLDWSLAAKDDKDDKGNPNGPLTDTFKLLELMTAMAHYGKENGYRAAMQGTPHNMPHNYLGGHMRSMRSPTDPIFWSHHAFIDKNWALWQDCVDVDELTKAQLNEDAYVGMQRKDLPDDGIDAPMPFRITDGPYKPAADSCSEAASASSECRKCLGQLSSNFAPCSDENPCWCEQRWHPNCFQLCPDPRCAAKCGTGGTDKEITSSDWLRKDGKKWAGSGYTFDYQNEKDSPRDWSVITTDLPLPYTYDYDSFDMQVASTTCNMNGKVKNGKVSLMTLMLQTGQTTKWASWATWRQADSWKTSLDLYQAWKDKLAAESKIKAGAVQRVSWAMEKATKALTKGITEDKATTIDRATVTETAALQAMQEEAKHQCDERDKSPMCKSSAKGNACDWDCAGPVDKQPLVCGFNLCWMYLQAPNAKFISDSCHDLGTAKSD